MTYPPQYQPPQYQYPYAVVQRPPSNGQAIAAMICGIVAIAVGVWALVPLLGIISAVLAIAPAIVAVILGHVGMNTSARLNGIGRGQAITGLVLGYTTVAILAGTTIFWQVVIATSSTS